MLSSLSVCLLDIQSYLRNYLSDMPENLSGELGRTTRTTKRTFSVLTGGRKVSHNNFSSEPPRNLSPFNIIFLSV